MSYPCTEGFYWAKLLTPTSMPAKEDWASDDWEVVQLIFNNGEGEEEYGVFVGGVGPMQWRKDFAWGPMIEKPKDLG